MNPILPIQHFVPDAEARQRRDGRIYLYGSYDISGRTGYCSWVYRVFSSADLIHWVDHGESFRTPPRASVTWIDSPLFAPDCIYHNGRYYLSFCDAPEPWNNHGSIAEFNGQWCVFYHRSSQASRYNRRVCVEPIRFNADGSIDEVEMTTRGVRGPLPAPQLIAAWRACRLSRHVRTAADGPTGRDPTVREWLTQIHHGDWAACKYVDFDASPVSVFHARVGSLAHGGLIEVRLDAPDGELLGACPVPHTGGWQKWITAICPVKAAQGIRAVYLLFRGAEEKRVFREFDSERLFDLDSFWFAPQ